MKEQKKKYDKLNITEKAKLITTIVNDIQKYAYLGETVKNFLTKDGVVCTDCGKEVEIPYDITFMSGKGRVLVCILCKTCKTKRQKKK